ncbi:MAG: ABC transporter permease [Vicinamibacteria bacterium]
MKKPPRLALALLERTVRGRAREEITGDLIEEYESRERSRLWFWKQAVSVAWSYSKWRKPRMKRMNRAEGLLHDLRSSSRALRRRPGSSAAVLALLILAVGANAAMFYWVDGIWNRSLPYADSDRLVRLFHTRDGVRQNLSPPNYFDLLEEQQAFDSLAAYWSPRVTLTGEGEPERLLGATVSHAFFDVLGAPPLLGWGFVREDDVPGAPPVVVLGHGLFQRRFGGDRGVIGRDIFLDGMAAKVIGVAPESFSFPAVGTELWVPLRLPRDRADQGGTPYRSFRILDVVGRLQDGVSLEQARARLASISESLAREYPSSNLGFRLEVEDLKEVELAPLRAPIFFLWAAVFLLLLIVCANVSGLWIARLASRERELAIRLALGASRARLVRELSGEGLILSSLGVALGCLLGAWVVAIVRAGASSGFAVPSEVEPGIRLLVFVLAIFVTVTVAFVAAPALFGAGRDRRSAPIGGTRRRRESAGRGAAVPRGLRDGARIDASHLGDASSQELSRAPGRRARVSGRGRLLHQRRASLSQV